MDLLIELFGIEKANELINRLKNEIKNMSDDYYIRNAIRIGFNN